MTLSAALHKKVVNFLTSLPGISDNTSLLAFINSASLDTELKSQIKYPGSSTEFFNLLVPQLIQYGQLEDGRNALVAILNSAKDRVGWNKKECYDALIQEISKYLEPLPLIMVGDRVKLSDLLGRSPIMQNEAGRNPIVKTLPDEISTSIKASSHPKVHVLNILDTCLNYPKGIEELAKVISFFDAKTRAFRNFKRTLNEILFTSIWAKLIPLLQTVALKSEELREICRDCLPESIKFSLPECPEEQTLWRLLSWLADKGRLLSSRRVPLLDFVAQLRYFVKEPIAKDQIEVWIQEVGKYWGLSEEEIKELLKRQKTPPSPPSKSYLLITLEERLKGSSTYIIQQARFETWLEKENSLHRKSGINIYAKNNALSFDQISEVVYNDIIVDNEWLPKKQDLTLEFFLPKDLLSLPIDQGIIVSEINSKLGGNYRVVVRSKDRFDKKDKIGKVSSSRLRDYWDRSVLQNDPTTCVVWIDRQELTDLEMRLDEGYCFFALTFPPKPNFIFQLITLGVPFILWPRKLPNPDEVEELRRLLSRERCQRIEQLPEVLREERLKIPDGKLMNEEYITYHLSLLWDDYDRPLSTSSFMKNIMDSLRSPLRNLRNVFSG